MTGKDGRGAKRKGGSAGRREISSEQRAFE